MKRIIMGLLSGILFLTACGQSTLAPQATPQPDKPTTTPSPTPTASITPLPTIPTFTPTFDVSTIVTVTPAPKAKCPKENPELTLDLNLQETRAYFRSVAGTDKNPSDCINRNIQNDILNYLNQG